MSRDIYNRRDLESGAFSSARQLWMFHRIIPISISFFFSLDYSFVISFSVESAFEFDLAKPSETMS